MKRRNFVRVALGVAAGVAVAPTCLLATEDLALVPLPALLSRKIEYLDEISPNYRAWREAQIEIVKQGYTIRWASLERPVGGFRRARVYTTDKTGNDLTFTWLQPWCAEDCAGVI